MSFAGETPLNAGVGEFLRQVEAGKQVSLAEPVPQSDIRMIQSYCPVPLSAMLKGEPGAPYPIVMAVVSGPVALGAKWPWMMQLAPAARLVPQLLAKTNEDASAPLSAMPVRVSVELLALVMVTDCEPLDVPSVVGAYDSARAERVIAGVTPAPLSAMV